MSDFKKTLAEYLGIQGDPEELPLSPLDGAAMGLQKLGERGSAALRPLGARLDARLGTTARQRPPREPDPLMPQETTPPANLGLFETLGHAVPHVATAVAGMKMPMDGPTGPGVAAFPTPKQSFARMKDEAVLRDMLESKGATPINGVAPRFSSIARLPPREMEVATPPLHDALRGGFQGKPPRRPLDTSSPEVGVALDDARTANFHEAKKLGMFPSNPDGLLGGSEAEFAQGAGRGPGRRAVMPAGRFPVVPKGPVSAEQSELERYLAGLYGPGAPK